MIKRRIMHILQQRVVNYIEQEWGTYIERFNRLSADEQAKQIRATGYESLHDLLAHIVAWWEEDMEMVRAIAEGREYDHKKYDIDAFNAEAVAKYKAWDDAKFLSHFEEVRRKTVADLKSMDDSAFENHRLKQWLHGIIIYHAREHLLVVSRFITEDTLEYEWGEYVETFNSLPPERQAKFLSKQGFARFRDIVAHIIGWWEEGLMVIENTLNDPAYQWQERDTDRFNTELVEKYSAWSEMDLFAEFENVRRRSLGFIKKLSDDDNKNPVITEWITADFIKHLDDH
jgi:hypothetical protein